MRKYLKGILMIFTVMLIGVLAGCSNSKEENEEELGKKTGLLESVEWQDDSKKIEEFKKYVLSKRKDQ